ncbi:TRAP transporter small permease [Stutzerimonas azotifigens]|uniref:TRAP transporter small permease n=1 Tax=Stutzerimonas azotifigens TaxID=291995 RepID=UPI00040E6E51|nr:TRAP transporter small permease [Stutzerimonas azotifigens]
MIRGLARLSGLIDRFGALCGMLLIVYMLGHILLEVGLRLFGRSTYVLDEFIGYGVAAMIFLSLPYALERGALIRVPLLLERLAPRWRWPLELLAALGALAAFALLASSWFKGVQRSYQRQLISDTMAQTPLWIPEAAVLVGLGMLCLSLTVRALLILSRRGGYAG